jgi:hypothetical protein
VDHALHSPPVSRVRSSSTATRLTACTPRPFLGMPSSASGVRPGYIPTPWVRRRYRSARSSRSVRSSEPGRYAVSASARSTTASVWRSSQRTSGAGRMPTSATRRLARDAQHTGSFGGCCTRKRASRLASGARSLGTRTRRPPVRDRLPRRARVCGKTEAVVKSRDVV